MPIKSNIVTDVNRIKKRLSRVEAALSEEVANALADLGRDILEDSNNWCPYKTGELRNSGIAWMMREGRRDKHLVYRIGGAGPNGGGEPFGVGFHGPQRSKQWNMEITYERYNPKDAFDVAHLAHELLPHGEGPYEARKENTGGKFLERSYIRHIAGFEGRIGKRINDAIESTDYQGISGYVGPPNPIGGRK